MRALFVGSILFLGNAGCATSKYLSKVDSTASGRTSLQATHPASSAEVALSEKVAVSASGQDSSNEFALVGYSGDENPDEAGKPAEKNQILKVPSPSDEEETVQFIETEIAPEATPASEHSSEQESLTPPVAIKDVIASIHSSFPLLEAAYLESQIARGKQTAAWGAFDTKLKATSESGALGFYQNFRNSAGFSRPVYDGGEVFGGYRVGRGDIQPWYQERQTNDGGEFKAGVNIPLLRNREIDARRAELWRANYDRMRVEPEIRSQLILFVRDGSIAYWKWVAAGRQYEIGQRALELAEQRNAQLKRKITEGQIDPPVLQDNLRAIAKREAKLIDLQRKVQQSAVKLSLFLRSIDGIPVVPAESRISSFPEPSNVSSLELDNDVAIALSQRPELESLRLMASRVNVDLNEARNDLLPKVDFQVIGSQDVGGPSSSKRDKSQFELEAGVFVEVPIERRKARGKSQAATGKLAQINAKRRFTEDKIKAEMQTAYAALLAGYERLDKARESKRLAEYMAEVERRKFDLGDSNLLSVVLREQYAIEAAESEVDALLEYYSAKAFYDSAMARDWPE